MLSRQELERKSIAELKRLCAMYGVNPIGGTSRDREALIRALIAFP